MNELRENGDSEPVDFFQKIIAGPFNPRHALNYPFLDCLCPYCAFPNMILNHPFPYHPFLDCFVPESFISRQSVPGPVCSLTIWCFQCTRYMHTWYMCIKTILTKAKDVSNVQRMPEKHRRCQQNPEMPSKMDSPDNNYQRTDGMRMNDPGMDSPRMDRKILRVYIYVTICTVCIITILFAKY